MKIIKTAHRFTLSLQKSNYCVNAGDAGKLFFDNGKLTYIAYLEKNVAYRYFKFNSEWYKEYITDGVRPFSYIPYQTKKFRLIDSTDKDLAISPEKLYCIINNRSERDEDFYASYIRDFPEKRKKSLAWFDPVTDEFQSSQQDLLGCTYKQGFFYGLDFIENEFVQIDRAFNRQWSFKPPVNISSISFPVFYPGLVLSFFGPIEKNRKLIDGKSHYSYSGGQLVGLNDADGTPAWQLEIPHATDGLLLHGDTLYVASLNEILLISPESGQVIHIIDTQTSTPVDRDFGVTLYVDKSYIYYCHHDDALILIYDVNSYELVKRIELPEGYHANRHNFHDKQTGKQYFSLFNRTQYVAQQPILEIDLSNLDAPIEFEQEPEMSIELCPSKDDAQVVELVIHMKTASLDDALRFGEIHTRDYAQWHSFNHMGMTFADRTPTENFNGIIRFIYSGCDQPTDVVKQHLAVMEQRFEEWNAKEGFYSHIDKHQLTKLVATYVDSIS